MGLARAVEQFNACRGYALRTYASQWIRQAVQRAGRAGGIIHLPTDIASVATQVVAEGQLSGLKSGLRHRVETPLRARSLVPLDQTVFGCDGDGTALVEVLPARNENPLDALEWQLAVDQWRQRAPEEIALLKRQLMLGTKEPARSLVLPLHRTKSLIA